MLGIGEKIYLWRHRQGVSQAALAGRAGIAQPNLSNIEKGKQDVTVTTLSKIAYALNVPVRDFFEKKADSSESRHGFSRERVERMAQAIVGRSVKLDAAEAEIVRLVRKNLTGKRRKEKVRMHDLYTSWMTLKQYLTGDEIKGLLRRVRDAEKRLKPHE